MRKQTIFIFSFSSIVSANDKLIKAVSNNNLQKLKDIVNSSVGVNYYDNKGKTALTYAAGKGKPVIAEYLIDQGAIVNVTIINYENSPLPFASAIGNREIAELLLKIVQSLIKNQEMV